MMEPIIFHCDLDCFYASVEMRDNPKYKGKPVIIGADPKGGKGRGVISTCSYEARMFGLHSAMPISQAYNLCPQGIYLRPHIDKYHEASEKVMEILKKNSSQFQQVGLDEAYIQSSEPCGSYEEVRAAAENIKQEVFKKVGITISIGCAPTKSLAKIASDLNKPDGITIIEPEQITSSLKDLDITKIPGIGKKTKVHYYKKGIKKIGDILKLPQYRMIEMFGKHGKWAWNVVHGKDEREIKEIRELRKSISKERTFYEDTDDYNAILSKFEEITKRLGKNIAKEGLSFRTITLKIRFEGFETYTRSKTYSFPLQDKTLILKTVLELFKEFSRTKKKVRLVGIKLSNFINFSSVKQTNLFNFATF